MEAYPFVDEICLILSTYWKTTPPEQRSALPGAATIEHIRDLVIPVLEGDPGDAEFLKSFMEKPEDRNLINEFGSRLKLHLYRDPELAANLEALAREYREFSQEAMSYNVNIEWGDSYVSGSTAQVKQERKVEVDTIDLSKYIEP